MGVTADSIKAILSSVGVESDDKSLDIVVKQLAGKSVEELVAAGLPKLASMGGGGGGAAPAAAAAGGDAGAAAPAPEKRKMMIWDSGSSIKQYSLMPSSYMFIYVRFVL